MASVMITGTSKGIGFAAAREKLPITISAMDVDSDQSVSDGIATIHKDHGPKNVLVNIAGVERMGSVEELPLSDFRAVMETNYFGALRCIQAVAAHMRQRRAGCIINLTSVAGRIANAPMAPYTASKWALEALSEALAGEMKSFNVRVAIVEPGIIDTAMARRIGDKSAGSPYPQSARFASLFSAALKKPVPPSLVAQKIVEIAESGTWQLRHPVGPDAAPLLKWRSQMTDEQGGDLNSAAHETWYRSMGLEFDPKN